MSIFDQYLIVKADDISSALGFMTFVTGGVVGFILLMIVIMSSHDMMDYAGQIILKRLLIVFSIFHFIVMPLYIFIPDTKQIQNIIALSENSKDQK